MIAGVMVTLLLYRGAQVNTDADAVPLRRLGLRLARGGGRRSAALGSGVNSVLGTVFLLLNVAVIVGLPGLRLLLQAPAHLHGARSTWPSPAGPGRSAAWTRRRTWTWRTSARTPCSASGLVEQFTWKQMLDFATCTECGRCQSACPAWNTEKPLSPKLLIMGLRDNMFASSGRLLAGKGRATAATTAGRRR